MKLGLLSLSCGCCWLLTFSTGFTSAATIITFDSPPLNTGNGSYIANDYQGLSWSNFYRLNGILSPSVYPSLTNGYYYGVVSSSNVVYNGLGNPAEIDSATNFDFLSVYLTGAWHSNLNIEVQGFRGGNLLYDQTVEASATNPTLFTFNYLNIDRLYLSSYGGQPAFPVDGGNHFVMDNFTFEFVPEPSSLLLVAAGGLALRTFVRRRRA